MSQEAMAQEAWHPLGTAANLLQVSERTVHRWILSGRLQSKRDESGRRIVKVDIKTTTAGQIEAAVNRVREETEQKARHTEEALASACEVNITAQEMFEESKIRVKMARRAVFTAWSVALMAVAIAIGMAVLLALSGNQRAQQVLTLVDNRDAALSVAQIAEAKLAKADLEVSSIRAQLRQLTLELQSAENQRASQQIWATPASTIEVDQIP